MAERDMQSVVRTIYLYMVAFIGLAILAIGCIHLIDFGLEFIIPDQKPTNDAYRYYADLRYGIATIVVGLPLWLYHWRIIQADRSPQDTEHTNHESK